MVKTLQARGYLYTLGSPKRLYPTKRLLSIAERISAQDPIVEYVAPALTTLRDTTTETVILGKRQGDEIVYLEVLEGLNVIRYSAKPGDLKPLHSSAIGKLILGELPADDARRTIARLKLEQITENTVTDADELLSELAASRAHGYYATQGENVAEVMAIAVPVELSGDTFGIALAGPISRMHKQVEAHLAALIECRDSVAEAIG